MPSAGLRGSGSRGRVAAFCLGSTGIKTLFGVLFGLGLVLIVSLHLSRGAQEMREIRHQEISRSALGLRIIEGDLSQVRADVLILANHRSFRSLVHGDAAKLVEVREEALKLASIRPRYAMIRLLDANGKELVRIERTSKGPPQVLQKGRLQAKGHRYYFREGIDRAFGEVYTSPLDLNVEHGKIERPFRPMIRTATPVADWNWKKSGLVVLNYDASQLLNELSELDKMTRSQLEVINGDGYWLRHPDPSREWGFMLAERMNQTLGVTNSEIFGWMQEATSAQRILNGDLLTTGYVTLDPVSGVLSDGFNSSDRSARNPYLRLLSRVPAHLLKRDTWWLTAAVSLVWFLTVFALAFIMVSLGARARLQDREKELLAKQSRHDRRMAEEATELGEARMRFLANMSHEIRTPLNGILGMADHLLHGELSEEQRSSVRLIHSSGSALLAIVNDILDFSKADAGHLRLEMAPTVLDDICSDCVSLLRPTAEAKGLELTLALPKHRIRAKTDGARVRQILLNLLGNGIKFTESGRVEIRLWSEPPRDDKFWVTMEVIDTGVGIPEDRLESIFEAFSQAETSTSRRFGGTGLGLTISRQLARALGGEISAESTLGRGSTFRVRLELTSAPDELHEETAAKPTLDSSGEMPSSVLIVDDDRINRVVLRRLLERLGCREIGEAADGQAAVEAVIEGRWAVVLMDVQMPGLDGLEATRRIRKKEAEAPHHPQTPIIAVTANAVREEKHRCIEAGTNDYLTKPVSGPVLAELLSLVRSST